jgi:hypothetical protein
MKSDVQIQGKRDEKRTQLLHPIKDATLAIICGTGETSVQIFWKEGKAERYVSIVIGTNHFFQAMKAIAKMYAMKE